MVTQAVTTTIAIQFDDTSKSGSSGHLSAEIDSRVDGLNAGKTSFEPGDTVHILVYKSANVAITNVLISAGSIYPGQPQAISHEDFVTFNNEKTASLSKPATGGMSVSWYGQSLGNLLLGADQVALNAARKGVAVAKVSYTSQAQSYRLSTPLNLGGATSFKIAVVIIGTVN